MIRQLSDDEAWALLRTRRLARLGCIVADVPYVVPVNYVADGTDMLVHSLPGRKLTAMRARPRVCLQVDDIEDQYHWRSVVAYGTFSEIKESAARARAISRLLASFPDLTPVESRIAGDAHAPGPIVFRIRIDQLTGIEES